LTFKNLPICNGGVIGYRMINVKYFWKSWRKNKIQKTLWLFLLKSRSNQQHVI